MLKRFRPSLSYANVASTIALVAALGTGGAYAADTIGSSDVIDESLLSQDIKNGQVKFNDVANNSVGTFKVINDSLLSADIKDANVFAADLADNAVTSAKINDGAVGTADLADNSVDSNKVANESLTASDLATDSVQATEVANNSIDSGEIVDFGLSNQDVGVEFAQLNADGTVANSSGGVTATHIGAGTYDVDFGHNITSCAFVATQGEAGVGGAGGAITGVTDRSGNVEAAFVTTRTNANVLADRAFQMLVVC